MRFDYVDDELSYPLLVERREMKLESGHVTSIIWRVDYVRSHLLWAREQGIAAPNPSYGQWCRVDDCVTDALAHWPEHPETGKPPGTIAFNGGWFNGHWERDFYRHVRSGLDLYGRDPSKDPVIDQPWAIPLDSPAPAPWRLGPRPDDRAGEYRAPGRVEPRQIKEFLDEIVHSRLHFVSSDGKRKLIVLPPSPETLFNERIGARLLYADQDIVTDVLQATTLGEDGPTRAHWGTTFDRRFPSAIFDPGAPSSVLDRKRADFIPWVIIEDRAPRPFPVKCLPLWVARRLGEACMSVLLSFPRTLLAYARVETSFSGEPSDKPSESVSVEAGSRGGMGSSEIIAARSLVERASDRGPYRMAHMFDENLDEAFRPRVTPKERCYWDYDASSQTLSNGSGQRISFQGNVRPLDFAQTNLRCFLYEDPELQYPLVVERPADTVTKQTRYIWQIDHERSAQLWRKLGNHDQPVPSYGCWRRVEACATDAFLCWPGSEATGPRPWRVESKGGWLNGAWLPTLRRRFDSNIDYKYGAQPQFYYRNIDDEPPAEAFLDPLDTPRFTWEYVDSREIGRSADLDFIDIRGSGITGLRRDERTKSGLSYLPEGSKLTGFENSMPSLRRSDGRAVMFPAGLRSDRGPRGEGYYPNPFFLYADEDVALQIAGNSYGGSEGLPSTWFFKLDHVFRIALRRREQFDPNHPEVAPPDLFVQYTSRFFISRHPAVAFSRKLTAALTDGWIAWTGTDRRLLDDPAKVAEIAREDPYDTPPLERSGIDLKQKKRVSVEGGYIGGRYSSRNTVTVWIDEA